MDIQAAHIRRHLRPLFCALNFSSVTPECPWLAALAWVKDSFSGKPWFAQRPVAVWRPGTPPALRQPWLLVADEKSSPSVLYADRYEFWLYRQIRKRLESGELYLDDSLQHRYLSDEPVSVEEKADVLAQMDIPFLRKPIGHQLRTLTRELHRQ